MWPETLSLVNPSLNKLCLWASVTVMGERHGDRESSQEGIIPFSGKARTGGQEFTNTAGAPEPECLLKSLSTGESHSVHWPEWN